jgi:hypothetical protein
MEVMCICGLWGRMSDLGGFDKNGKQLVSFVCSCLEPKPNWEQPFEEQLRTVK